MKETAEAAAVLNEPSAISPATVDLYNRCLDKDLDYLDIAGQVGSAREVLAKEVNNMNTLFIIFYISWVAGTTITGIFFVLIFISECC
jgi:hypothetical protein